VLVLSLTLYQGFPYMSFYYEKSAYNVFYYTH